MPFPDSSDEHEDKRFIASHEVYKILSYEGRDELERPFTSLMWSGVVAGLCISFSLIAEGILRHHLPDTPGRFLIENFGYCIGFIIVIIGRFQLFTENTISAVLPMLYSKTLYNISLTARLWGVVFFANITGTFIMALLIVYTNILSPDVLPDINALSHHAVHHSPTDLFIKAIPAGFLVAAITWLLPNATFGKFFVILMMTYLIAIGDFSHVIVGSAEVFTLMVQSEIAIWTGLQYLLIVGLGNIMGGTGLFTLLAYAQVHKEIRH